jgi:hypothetical protein
MDPIAVGGLEISLALSSCQNQPVGPEDDGIKNLPAFQRYKVVFIFRAIYSIYYVQLSLF